MGGTQANWLYFSEASRSILFEAQGGHAPPSHTSEDLLDTTEKHFQLHPEVSETIQPKTWQPLLFRFADAPPMDKEGPLDLCLKFLAGMHNWGD